MHSSGGGQNLFGEFVWVKHGVMMAASQAREEN
jgi:hypothetical protein